MPDTRRFCGNFLPKEELQPPNQFLQLKNIPLDSGPPFIGHQLKGLLRPEELAHEMQAKYGTIYSFRIFNQTIVAMNSPDANEFVLKNTDQGFSNKYGWGRALRRLFPRSLMLLDAPHHKIERETLKQLFHPVQLKNLIQEMNWFLLGCGNNLPVGNNFDLHDYSEKIITRMGQRLFTGITANKSNQKLQKSFLKLGKSAAVHDGLQFSLLGGKSGMKARDHIKKTLKPLIKERRDVPRSDVFSQLCTIRDKDRKYLSDRKVIDHTIFLWLACHDALISSMTSFLYRLARHTEWQERLRTEIKLTNYNKNGPCYQSLQKLELTEWAFKESLRMTPPMSNIPRMVTKPLIYKGYQIPEGTLVCISPLIVQNDPNLWADPEVFDPIRFAPSEVRRRHKYAWIPFGGGDHHCLGLEFAMIQAKIILSHLLPRFSITLASNKPVKFQTIPQVKPKGGLMVCLSSIE